MLLSSYAHYSSMQVRRGAVRGLDLHLARLGAQHRELFGTDLDRDRVRTLMRHAVSSLPDAYLRVSLDEPVRGRPRVLTVVRPPVEASPAALSLMLVPYARPFPHIKHVGTFAQTAWALRAQGDGYDDAVLVAPDGQLCETTISNLGLLGGDALVWPAGPALAGITRQLLDRAAREAGMQVAQQSVSPAQLGSFAAAFTSNSIAIQPVARVGEHRFEGSDDRVARLIELYDAVPWDEL